MHSFRHGDCTFAYEIIGEGRPVLFLNGSGSTIAMVRPLVEVLGRSLRVAVHDQRGLGATSVPEGPFSMAQYAEDARAFLDHLEWQECAVLGISFGGMVAQELAVTWPDRVERMVLCCTSPGGDGGRSYPLHEPFALEEADRRRLLQAVTDTRFTDEFLAANPRDRALLDRPAPTMNEEARQGARRQLEARRSHDVWDRLGAITCPTLVMSGRFDGIAPPENGAAIASRIRSAEHRVYDGGHPFFLQDSRALPDMVHFLTSDDR